MRMMTRAGGYQSPSGANGNGSPCCGTPMVPQTPAQQPFTSVLMEIPEEGESAESSGYGGGSAGGCYGGGGSYGSAGGGGSGGGGGIRPMVDSKAGFLFPPVFPGTGGITTWYFLKKFSSSDKEKYEKGKKKFTRKLQNQEVWISGFRGDPSTWSIYLLSLSIYNYSIIMADTNIMTVEFRKQILEAILYFFLDSFRFTRL